jgi:hypothetical protein
VALRRRHSSVCSVPTGQKANVFVHNARASGVKPAGGLGFLFTDYSPSEKLHKIVPQSFISHRFQRPSRLFWPAFSM